METPYVSFIRLHGKRVVISTVILETQASELTKYYCVNCHFSAITMPIRLSSYVTWSTSETGFRSAAIELHVLLPRRSTQSHGFVTSMQPLYSTKKKTLRFLHVFVCVCVCVSNRGVVSQELYSITAMPQ